MKKLKALFGQYLSAILLAVRSRESRIGFFVL